MSASRARSSPRGSVEHPVHLIFEHVLLKLRLENLAEHPAVCSMIEVKGMT